MKVLTDVLKDVGEIGGKAYNLLKLQIKNTPRLYVCPASYFRRAKTEPSLCCALEEDIQKTLSDIKLYAVRSSAIDEDSAADSFAGVHESFLNVRKRDVFNFIGKVYESAFTERAMAYRKTRGLSTENIEIAVVIQEMVDAEYAGVINTINPVTDNPDEIVISVACGLGDKIVDGSESGTVYIVNHGNVKRRGEDILSEKILFKIVRLAEEVAAKTDRFQDIEFAYSRGKAWFLQARAITTYGSINPHERELLLDNSNIIESFFGVVSPLTFTFAKDIYRDVYCAALKKGRVRGKTVRSLEPYLAEMLYYYDGRVYYNMNSWYRGVSVFPVKKSAAYLDNMIGVRSKSQGLGRVKMNIFGLAKLGVLFLHYLRHIEELAADFEEKFEKTVMPYYGKKLSGTDEQLRAIARNLESITDGFVVPIINDIAVMYYFGRLGERAESLGVSAEELNGYISNRGDVLSAGSASALVEIVEKIRLNGEYLKDFENLDADGLYEKYRSGTPLSESLRSYIMAYGARVPDELKLETVTMIEDEKILYRMLKDNLMFKDNLCAEPQKTPRSAAKPPEKLRRLAEKTKRHIKIRERLRLKRTYLYSVVRNIFLAFGENYFNEGRIDDARDIFYLTKQEALSGEGDFKKLVRERKLEEESYKNRPVHDRIVFFGGRALPVKSGKAGGGLRGIPSGGGVVRAKVSLMRSPSDRLEKGNIILAERTDPGWISLFPSASGLIVEHGSMLSHSFVVARELNLPAVVGVEHATTLIPDGAYVLLDGISGEVKIEKSD